MLENNKQIAKVFKAICDENRVAIIKLLQSGEKCACHIAQALQLSQSKLSYHMKILCESNLVECWYVGKWTHYKINPSGSALAVCTLQSLTKEEITSENCKCEETLSC